MQKDKIKQMLRYGVPFVTLAFIFGIALACGGGEPSTEEVSKAIWGSLQYKSLKGR